jgi:hypothetical protein
MQPISQLFVVAPYSSLLVLWFNIPFVCLTLNWGLLLFLFLAETETEKKREVCFTEEQETTQIY